MVLLLCNSYQNFFSIAFRLSFIQSFMHSTRLPLWGRHCLQVSSSSQPHNFRLSLRCGISGRLRSLKLFHNRAWKLLGLRYLFRPKLDSFHCVSVSLCPFEESSHCRAVFYHFLSSSLLARLGFPGELQVCWGFEEARVAVFLHQGVDFGLGHIETGLAGLLHVLFGDRFGFMVEIYL